MLDPYQDWLGIPKVERPVDYYRLLDLSRDVSDEETIRKAAETRSRLVIDRLEGPNGQISARILREIDDARIALSDPLKRKAYDARLKKLGLDGSSSKPDVPKVVKRSAENTKQRTKERNAAPPSKRWIWLSLAGVVLLLMAGGGGFAWYLRSTRKQGEPAPALAVVEPALPRDVPPPSLAPVVENKAQDVAKAGIILNLPAKAETPAPAPFVMPVFKAPEIPAPPRFEKLLVPAPSAQAAAETSLRRLYRQDYADPKPEGCLALAAKLLQPGRENRQDAAAWFVLLREARDLAVRAERAHLALEAVNELDKWFIIDAPAMRFKILQSLSQASSEGAARSVGETALALAEQSVADDDYQNAGRMIELAQAAANKIKDRTKAVELVASRKAEIQGFQRNHQAVVASQLKIKRRPDDAEANLIIGKELCLFHGKWTEGLAFLAKGSDADLKKLAQKDLTNPVDTTSQVSIGDGWWNYADKLKDREERSCRQRAAHWYETALPKAEALEKLKAESRIAKVQDKMSGRFVRLLPGSFYGRDVEDRILLLREGGGTMQSEEAVARGLRWLVDHQARSGMWSLDRFHEAGACNCTDPGLTFDVAGTAFGLLPLLGAGNTHVRGPYAKAVAKGIRYLLSVQKAAGNFSDGSYENALATMVMCEDYGLTHDRSIGSAAQRALNFIASAQHANGSWGYGAGQKGDTSITAFQFIAEKSGVYAALHVPATTLTQTSAFLDEVADVNGLGYGYNTRGAGIGTSAAGLLCRMYMGWGPSHPLLARGVGQLYYSQNITPEYKPGMYFIFYATQLMHHVGGRYWQAWNPKIRELLIAAQDKGEERPHGHQEGSWSGRGDPWEKQGGRLMATSLTLLTLEVYYLNIPLYNFGSAVMVD